MILNVTRQGGKSTTGAALATHTALYRPGSLTLIVSPSERQSGELFKKCVGVYRATGRSVPAESETTVWLELGHGARAVALPGEEGTIPGSAASAASTS